MHQCNQNTARILVVDDEPRMCDSLTYLLNAQNFDVRTALTGSDAMEWFASEAFDVAILDIGLPDIDRIELLKRIRNTCPDTYVVIVTGKATLDSALSAIRNGAFDYLKKPFEYEQLLNTIGNILQQKTLCRQNTEINGKLSASKERYRYLVKNSPDIIYILDKDGHFDYISDAVESLLGYQPEALIGRHFSSIVVEEDIETCKWFFQERRTGDRATKGVELRLKVSENIADKQENDFHHITVELKSTGMYISIGDKAGTFLGTHGVARDISLRKRLERQIKQMERMEAIGTLAAGIAHNFNNLLMTMQGNASLILLNMAQNQEENRDYIKRLNAIIDCSHSGANLTGQLLRFARSTDCEIKPVDMNRVLSKSSTLFGKARKEIRIRENFHPELWLADADEQCMEQVLLNMYANAWHAMPDGGELILSTENMLIEKTSKDLGDLAPGRYVKISVADTGSGIDEATQKRIFEPFFSTKKVGQGTGLGLASAFGTVKNLGGTIRVKSRLGKGSNFDIFLPASEKIQDSQEQGHSAVVKGTGTVLLVDDEPSVSEVLAIFLKTMGYHVELAFSGQEAILLYQQKWKYIDLVILDMVMPEMDGGAVFEALKRINPGVKAIIASGHCVEGRSEELRQQGCKGFIQKPFELNSLSGLVKDILED